MKSFAKSLFQRAGYDLRKRAAPVYGSQDALDSASKIVRHYTMLPNERLTSLYEQVRFCQEQPLNGAFVECGVWKGGAVGLMALAAAEGGPIRDLHLFDVFADICEPDPAIDGDRALAEASRFVKPSGRLQSMQGIYDEVGGHGTLEGCRKLIETTIGHPADRVHCHVGWFQNTLPIAAPGIGPIALLRLDGDWYASTKVCLEHLYDQVVSNGFVVIDDYGTYQGCKTAVDEFIASLGIHPFLQRVDGGCHYFIKPGR